MAKQVSLAPKLDTAMAVSLREELLAAAGDDLVLDGSNVEQLGGLSLELLMSVGALWRKDGHSVSLEKASPQLVDDLNRFGLTPDTLWEFTA